MSEDQRLEQKIDECRKQFEQISAIIEQLQKDHVHETRSEEKLRIGAKLKEQEQQRQTVEKTWQSLEAEKVNSEQQRLVQEARQLERNKAFKEALDTWWEIRSLTPDDPQAATEIQRLEERLQRSQRLTDTFKQLTRRLNEIQPIYQTVITRLRQMGETGVVDENVVGIVDEFLQGNLSADDFMEAWRALTTAGARDEPDYRALADRLKRGEIVLFLGSDIPRLLHIEAPIPETMIPALAQQANYQNYSGSLSMLAEYYQITDYGRPSLVQNLEAIIATTAPEISLYRLLAKIEQPLVLISVNYDMYLEQQLQQSGRKYALISSVICATPECEIGSVVVQYSDRETSEFLRLEQELSSLKLIENGYSLIYKIRGYCSSQSHRTAYQHHILTLAEENYFTFARHLDKLIPNYMVKQFAARGLFFLGYSPHNWEDRLLVNAILDKRRQQQQHEPARVITQESDPFVRAYWDFRGVHRYQIELSEFVRKLEAYLA